MRTGFSHPLWIHLPSVVALCAFLYVLATSGPLPASAQSTSGQAVHLTVSVHHGRGCLQ